MKKLKSLLVVAGLCLSLLPSLAHSIDDDRLFRLLLVSSYFAPELTTYGPYTTVGTSTTFMHFTEMLERISYNISVDSRIDKREVLDLRDDAVEYLAEGRQSTSLEFFTENLKDHEGLEKYSDEQIASIIIALGATL